MRHRVGAPLDRLDALRDDEATLTPGTAVLLLTDEGVAVRSDADIATLATVPLSALQPVSSALESGSTGRSAGGVEAASLATTGAVLLGDLGGARWAALALDDPADLRVLAGPDARIESVRWAATVLEPELAGLVLYAAGLIAWHRRARHCGACGAPSEPARHGSVRVCTDPGCAGTEFPRTDPAVITLLRRGDRALLIRQPAWPHGRFSCIAGFVEPGETLEQAVAREVMEEVGLDIATTDYFASQPWPFPHSLMVGFRAEAAAGEVVKGEEVAEWMWVTRDELREKVGSGEVVLSSSMSVARSLIDDWLEEG